METPIDFEYEIENEGTDSAQITIITYNGNETDVSIPSTIENLLVTKIGKETFYAKNLTKVVIPASVKNIEELAFAHNELASVIIPNNVTTIENYAFWDNELTSIIIPGTVTKIGDSAFHDNKLTSVIISEGVQSIGDFAFWKNKITQLTIPASLTEIGYDAFSENHLTCVEIPDTVTEIGYSAFSNNFIRPNIDSVESADSKILENFEAPEFSIMIYKHKITVIGYNRNDTSVIIPSEIDGIPVTAICEDVFTNCNVTCITVPDSVTEIDERAFLVNPVIDSTRSEANPEFSIVIDKNEITIIDYNSSKTEVVIPSLMSISPETTLPITKIAAFAFFYKKLSSVIIPDTVTEIGISAFSHNNLTKVIIPCSVKIIEEMAFQDNLLSNLIISEGVTEIGAQAFYDNQLKSVIIPESVKTIERHAFAKNKIASVTIPDSVTEISEDVFLPNGTEYFEGFKYKIEYDKEGENPTQITIIGYKGNSTEIIIPSTIENVLVTKVAYSAFENMNLTSVIIPKTVTEIGSQAFWCNNLTNIIIPASVTEIGQQAFAYNELVRIVIPASVTELDESAFDDDVEIIRE